MNRAMVSIYSKISSNKSGKLKCLFSCSSCLCSLPEIMEVDNVNPSKINSLHITEQRTNIIDLNKKRKLRAELLGLPIAKHKCWNGSLPLKYLCTWDENPEVEESNAAIVKGTAEGEAADDGSEHGSAKDSNGFMDDSDSAMSGHGESKFEPEIGKTWPYDRPSSSSYNWSSGSSSFKDSSYASDSTAMTEDAVDQEQCAFAGEEHCPSHDVNPLIGYGSHVHDLCPGYGDDSDKQYTEKKIEEILYLKEANPNNYVLSSGRWMVNQETPKSKRKPTIDQEFERYFSMLML